MVEAQVDVKPGVLYVLRNINRGVNRDSQNRLHPFYMIYISENGDVLCNHLQPKKMLDMVRWMCKGKSEPLQQLCSAFNAETKDGRNMGKYSALLGDAIRSIITVKEESELDSFFTAAESSALYGNIAGCRRFLKVALKINITDIRNKSPATAPILVPNVLPAAP